MFGSGSYHGNMAILSPSAHCTDHAQGRESDGHFAPVPAKWTASLSQPQGHHSV